MKTHKAETETRRHTHALSFATRVYRKRLCSRDQQRCRRRQRVMREVVCNLFHHWDVHQQAVRRGARRKRICALGNGKHCGESANSSANQKRFDELEDPKQSRCMRCLPHRDCHALQLHLHILIITHPPRQKGIAARPLAHKAYYGVVLDSRPQLHFNKLVARRITSAGRCRRLIVRCNVNAANWCALRHEGCLANHCQVQSAEARVEDGVHLPAKIRQIFLGDKLHYRTTDQRMWAHAKKAATARGHELNLAPLANLQDGKVGINKGVRTADPLQLSAIDKHNRNHRLPVRQDAALRRHTLR
eukprot:Opistho-2@9110